MQMCMYFPYTTNWVVVSNIFGILPRFFAEMIQFDEHIFQLGWFNHHLDSMFRLKIYRHLFKKSRYRILHHQVLLFILPMEKTGFALSAIIILCVCFFG